MAPNQRRVSFLPPSADSLIKENSILNDDQKEREIRCALVNLHPLQENPEAESAGS